MTGRKPKPTALKELQGNPGKRALNKREPKYPAADGSVPHGKLGKEAARLWRKMAPMLIQQGVLTMADLPALELLCAHYETALKAYKQLRVEGITVLTSNGTVMRNPAAGALLEHSRAFQKYSAEFGLTPSSRSKVTKGWQEEESLAEALFNMVAGETE